MTEIKIVIESQNDCLICVDYPKLANNLTPDESEDRITEIGEIILVSAKEFVARMLDVYDYYNDNEVKLEEIYIQYHEIFDNDTKYELEYCWQVKITMNLPIRIYYSI